MTIGGKKSLKVRRSRDLLTDRWKEGWTDGQTDDKTYGQMDGWTDRWSDRLTDGQINGQTDKATDGRTYIQIMNFHSDIPKVVVLIHRLLEKKRRQKFFPLSTQNSSQN